MCFYWYSNVAIFLHFLAQCNIFPGPVLGYQYKFTFTERYFNLEISHIPCHIILRRSRLMLKIYTDHLLKKYSCLPILYPFLETKHFSFPFKDSNPFFFYTEKIFQITEHPDKADYLLLPHNYKDLKHEKAYINFYIQLTFKYNKKLLIFLYGDSDEDVNIPNSIIFRVAQYKHKTKYNEWIMPLYADDLSRFKIINYRNKKARPTVGFCGYADFDNTTNYIKYILNIFLQDLKKQIFLNRKYEPQKRGLFFRRKAIEVLKKSKIVDSKIITRKFYSGSNKTIKNNSSIETIRSEYIDIIHNSDYILTTKGDSNISTTFFETMSLGRIPILISTDCVLPFEKIINYHDCSIIIDYRNLKYFDEILLKLHNDIDNDKFIWMQKKAREYFEKFLRIDAFYKNTIENLEHNLHYPHSSFKNEG